ncbi:MAG: peptide ABC transporter substrate-binding protein [Ruminococcaceae bacterium]|nr:peptide ABC transporter substrate-binding protein [Oscillospiraceae bacterium]
MLYPCPNHASPCGSASVRLYFVSNFLLTAGIILGGVTQIMKKLISMLLMAAMIVTLFAGCTTLEGDEKGAIINLYLASEISDYDPALAYTDDGAVKVLGLVYEGLTRINAKGQVENALMKSYKVFEDDEKQEYRMEITIKDTKWSDGRVVSADDVVYAWKRILDPEFSCAAASLLFDIKNARDVKMGDNSIDDLGVAAIDDVVIEVQFEGKIDYNQFLENLACLALVPLREDVVTRWDRFGIAVSTLCTNGPFAIKGIDLGESLMLERNVYYYRNTDDEEALDKYVLPYRLMINFEMDEEANTTAYENGEIFYLGEIGLSKRAAYAETATINDLLSTHSFVINCKNKNFSDAAKRKALSDALDRTAIAAAVTYADPATGLIPPAVYDKAIGDSFRANGGAILSATKAGGSGSGSFTLTVKNNAANVAIAELAKSQWEAAGWSVKLDILDAEDFKAAYETGDYDVIAIDYQCLTTDSFGPLSVFAPAFSGNGIDIQNDNYDAVPYIPGYDSAAYSEKIEAAFAEKDRAARSAILHEAEKILMEDLPIIPVVFNKDAYVFNEEVLSGIKDCYYGFRNFSRLNMKDWRTYQETTASDTTAAQ